MLHFKYSIGEGRTATAAIYSNTGQITILYSMPCESVIHLAPWMLSPTHGERVMLGSRTDNGLSSDTNLLPAILCH